MEPTQSNALRAKGFTLIELMIVVAVVAILALIALPQYSEQMRKGKRAEAMQALGDLQLREERWRAENPSYGTLDNLIAPTTAATYNGALKYYTVSVSGNTGSAYVLTATRKGDLANDPRCGNFTLSMASGIVSKGVSSGDVNYCWRQ